MLAFLVCALLVPSSWAASDLSKPTSSTSKKTAHKSTARTSSKKTTRKSSTAQRSTRKEGSRARLARLKMQPERATAIQQALFQHGYLNQEPTGVYDDATRDAMKRFQAEMGFPTTGLPESKSLMKLGLGPHPLPVELDPATQARVMTPANEVASASSSK